MYCGVSLKVPINYKCHLWSPRALLWMCLPGCWTAPCKTPATRQSRTPQNCYICNTRLNIMSFCTYSQTKIVLLMSLPGLPQYLKPSCGTVQQQTFEGENFRESTGSENFTEKTFTDCLKLNISGCSMPQNFVDKTFMDGSRTLKFTKVFSLESFPLYDIWLESVQTRVVYVPYQICLSELGRSYKPLNYRWQVVICSGCYNSQAGLIHYMCNIPTHQALDQQADVVVGYGAAIERGTLLNVLHNTKMEASCYGWQSTGKVSCVGQLHLDGLFISESTTTQQGGKLLPGYRRNHTRVLKTWNRWDFHKMYQVLTGILLAITIFTISVIVKILTLYWMATSKKQLNFICANSEISTRQNTGRSMNLICVHTSWYTQWLTEHRALGRWRLSMAAGLWSLSSLRWSPALT